MTLTVNDVEKLSFGGGIFGYRKDEVEEFRQEVIETLRSYVDEISRLQKEIKELKDELQKYEASEELLKQSVILAQKTRDEIIASARKEAENIVERARLEVEEISRSMAELEAERERFEFEFYGLLKGFIELLEKRRALSKSKLSPTGEDKAQTGAPQAIESKEQTLRVKSQEGIETKEASSGEKEKETFIFPEEALT